MASILSKLTIVPLKDKPTNVSSKSPTETRREKLIAKLQEQAELAKAQISGDKYVVHKTITTKAEDGTKSKSQKEVRVSPWFWSDPKTKGMQMVVRYGVKMIPLSAKSGHKAISVPNLKAIPAIVEQLIEATKNGELDDALAAAAIRQSK